MQLMGDVLTVLGSRLGIAFEPSNNRTFLVRHGLHPGIPMEIHAGIVVSGKTRVLPLTKEDSKFEFLDQGMTATTMTMGGIDSDTGLHVKLTVRIPFRPRDEKFSTTPTVFFNLQVDKLATSFRWINPNEEVEGKIFLGFSGEKFIFGAKEGNISVNYKSAFHRKELNKDNLKETISYTEEISCSDTIAVISGKLNGSYIEEDFKLKAGDKGNAISVAWCAYDEPTLNVLGVICPFKYSEQFSSLSQVVAWAKENVIVVEQNSNNVDGIFKANNLGQTTNHLMAQTLHAWLMNTWWVLHPNGQNWFTVWEGSCYFHSTVDVEYTQGPFYLALWPELLELELNEWSLFGKDGSICLGDRGKDTLFVAHDMGEGANCKEQLYPHDMEVEENANYLLLAYTHWRRTGIDASVIKNAEFIKKIMDFILACDTTVNGIPDKGCANTIDDASPAVQFGSEQVYLGVKAMVACQVGKIMLLHVGYKDLCKYSEFADKAKATIENEGFKDDHYVVTLTKTLDNIIDPWSGLPMKGELGGWDAYHIYTSNGLVLLDMTGYDSGLSKEKLRMDIETATPKTLGEYGCRHSSYENLNMECSINEGLAAKAPEVGWISMNMLRDMAAAYRGIDILNMADKYWDWQCTTNGIEVKSFFETFYGNNLCFYPRGVAIFGYFDSSVGFAYDKVAGIKNFAPIRASIQVPLLLFADWNKGTVPRVTTSLKDGKIEYSLIDG